MRPRSDVDEAFRLLAAGHTQAEVARRVGISRATVRDWSRAGKPAVLARPYRVRSSAVPVEPCEGTCPARTGLDGAAYSYLLGQFLGDGCLSRNGRYHRIRIFCADAYPNIQAEVTRAVRRVSGKEVRRIARQGCTELYASWAHWACFVPNGPGPKHTRPVVLADWQHDLAVRRNPAWLLRGLIHSDGCRITNRVVVKGRVYEYPRYFLSNKSPDIRALFLEACRRLDIDARQSNAVNVSVARRDAVTRLDSFVGPKS